MDSLLYMECEEEELEPWQQVEEEEPGNHDNQHSQAPPAPPPSLLLQALPPPQPPPQVHAPPLVQAPPQPHAPPFILTPTRTFLLSATRAPGQPFLLTTQGFPTLPQLLVNLPPQTLQPLTIIQQPAFGHMVQSVLAPRPTAPPPAPVSMETGATVQAGVATVDGAGLQTPPDGGKATPPPPGGVADPASSSDSTPRVVMSVEDFYYGTFQGDEELQSPPEAQHLLFKCHICNFHSRENLRMMQHLVQHSDFSLRLEAEDLKICRFCFRHFSSELLLLEHQGKVHGSQLPASLCRICEWAFDSESVLLTHMKSSHRPGEMPYVCKICSFRSSFYSSVLLHFSSLHATSSLLLCVFCLKVSRNHLTFQRHLLRHQVEGAYPCSRCRLQFVSLQEKLQHRKQHRSFLFPPQLRGLPPGAKVTVRTLRSRKAPPPYEEGSHALLHLKPISFSSHSHKQPISLLGSASSLPGPAPNAPPRRRSQANTTYWSDTLVCKECGVEASDLADHYPALALCPLCRYRTCCCRAYALHMVQIHGPRDQDLPLHRQAPPCCFQLECSLCGVVCQSGDKMAAHLLLNPDHCTAICKTRTYEEADIQLCEPKQTRPDQMDQQNLPEPSWTRAEETNPEGLNHFCFTQASGPTHFLPHSADAIDYFYLMFPPSLLELIVKETNSHVKMCHFLGVACSWTPLSLPELKCFIGLVVLMGIQNLPDPSQFWSPSHHEADVFKRTMSFKRFQEIAANIRMGSFITAEYRGHCNHDDPLHIFRPMLKILSKALWRAYQPNCCLTIDRSPLPNLEEDAFRWRTSGPPQVWLLCDSKSGYCHRFLIQMEKILQEPSGAQVEKNLQEPSGSQVDKNLQEPPGLQVEKNLQEPSGSQMEKSLQEPSGSQMEKSLQEPSGAQVEKNLQEPSGTQVEKNLQETSGSQVVKNLHEPFGSQVEKNIQEPNISQVEKNLQEPSGFQVVPHLVQGLENKHHQLYLANSLASAPLLEQLLDQGLYASSSFPALSPILSRELWDDGQLERAGDFLQWRRGPLLATRWKDAKEMGCLSTNAAPSSCDTVWRRSQSRAGELEPMQRPMAFRLLQENMRGVDICKQLLACNPLGGVPQDRRWRSLLWFLLNLSVVNAFIVLRESRRDFPPAWVQDGLFSQVNFRRRLGAQLARCGRRYLQVMEIEMMERSGRRVEEVDFTKQRHHLVKISSICKRCRNCNMKNVRHESVFGCAVCRANLCQQPHCFWEYHGMPQHTGSTKIGFVRNLISGKVEFEGEALEELDLDSDSEEDKMEEHKLLRVAEASETRGDTPEAVSQSEASEPPAPLPGGGQEVLSARQLRATLLALCSGVRQAALQFSVAPDLLALWLEVAGRRWRGEAAVQGEELLVEWLLCTREQGVAVTENGLFRKASALTQSGIFAEAFRISYDWAVGFMLRFRLGPPDPGEAPDPLLPRVLRDRARSFARFTRRLVVQRRLAPRDVAAMDELNVFLDVGAATPTLRFHGSTVPLLTVLLTALSDGSLLPPLVLLRGQVEGVRPSDSVLLESRPRGFTPEEGLQVWTDQVWRPHAGTATPRRNLLVLDRHGGHMADRFLSTLGRTATLPALIPAGCSLHLQPLSVCVLPALQRLLVRHWERCCTQTSATDTMTHQELPLEGPRTSTTDTMTQRDPPLEGLRTYTTDTMTHQEPPPEGLRTSTTDTMTHREPPPEGLQTPTTDTMTHQGPPPEGLRTPTTDIMTRWLLEALSCLVERVEQRVEKSFLLMGLLGGQDQEDVPSQSELINSLEQSMLGAGVLEQPQGETEEDR